MCAAQLQLVWPESCALLHVRMKGRAHACHGIRLTKEGHFGEEENEQKCSVAQYHYDVQHEIYLLVCTRRAQGQGQRDAHCPLPAGGSEVWQACRQLQHDWLSPQLPPRSNASYPPDCFGHPFIERLTLDSIMIRATEAGGVSPVDVDRLTARRSFPDISQMSALVSDFFNALLSSPSLHLWKPPVGMALRRSNGLRRFSSLRRITSTHNGQTLGLLRTASMGKNRNFHIFQETFWTIRTSHR